MKRSWTSAAFLGLVALLALGSGPKLQAAQDETSSILPPPFSVDAYVLGLEEPEEDPIEREEYWRRRRGDAPPAEIVRAQEKARRLPQALALPRTSGVMEKSIAPGGSPWVSFGPTPIGYGGTTYSGRVRTIAVDPTNPNVVYAGAGHGGVWKSTNGGSSWTPMSNEGSQPTLAMGSIAVDPRNPSAIYAGTGEPFGKGGRGILKSSDGGASWTLLGEGNPFPSGSTLIHRVLVNPVDGTVWVASNAGLVRSTNGTAFSRVTALPNVTAVDVAMSANGMRLYVAMLGWGIYRSNDGGSTWQLLTAGLPDASVWNGRLLRFAIAPSNMNVAYVLLDPAAGQTWFTTDGGNNWSPMAANPGAGSIQGSYNLEIAVDPLNPALVYVGAVSLTVTTAGTSGGGWSLIPGIYHVDQHAITFPTCTASPCPFYLGNDGGAYFMVPQSGDPSNVFADSKNTNLSITEFIGGDIGINFVDDPRAIGGSQDNATEVFVRNNPPYPENSLKWSLAAEMYADGGQAFLVQDPANPHIAYGTRQGTLGGPSRSDFWGYSAYTHLTAGLAGLDFYPAYDLDRSDRFHLVIASGGGVYEIFSPQTSWSPSSQNLGGTPSAVAIAPSDGKVIYAGRGSGVLYRKVSGQLGGSSTYALRNSGLSGKLWINSIAVDSSNPNVVYVAGSPTGSLPATAKTVYKTIDGGVNWTNVSGNLPPALPIYSIVTYFAGATRVLVIGTEAGVYFSTNDGQSWQAFNNGLPNIQIVRLALDRDRTTIAAFTRGRGAFSTSIAGTPVSCRVAPTFTITPVNQKRKRSFQISVMNNDSAQAECAAGLDFQISFEIVSGTWKSKPKSYTTGLLAAAGGTHVRNVRVWPTDTTTGGPFTEHLVSIDANGQPNGVYDLRIQGTYDAGFVGETTPVDPVLEAPYPSILVNGSEEPSVTIPYNGTASLTWSSVSATSCSLTYGNGVPAGSGLSGSLTVGPLTAPRTYSLICWNGSRSAIDSVLIQVQSAQTPFLGSPFAVPGTIQTEDFDNGGDGIAWHDTGAGNDWGAYRANVDVDIVGTGDTGGGYEVGNAWAGEWLEYTVSVASAGTYTFEARVGSDGPGGTFHVELDGVNKTGSISVPNTGGWGVWQTISRTVTLAAGQQVMRVSLDTNGAQPYPAIADFNWFRLTAAGGGNQLPSVSLTSPSPGQTFTAPATVQLNASASDADGTVTKVEFFQGATLLNTDTAAPYAFTWSNVPAGGYSLTARATDNLGATRTSTAVAITVSSSSCTPQCSGHYCGNGDGCGGICGLGSGCAVGCTPACNGVACWDMDPVCGDVCQLGSGCG